MAANNKVLSIQSHVIHGYVGNKSATFPLQVLGFEVDGINSVQFSNHTGYKVIKGQVLKDQELAELIQGLEANNILRHYSHLLTGYIGNATFLRQVADTVSKIRTANPNLVYVCDPVMGDCGKLYVPEELLPIYRDEIIPLADIVTPNQFEVELITGIQIKTEDDVWLAVKWFHERNVKIVAISSTELGPTNILKAYLSQKDGVKCMIDIPKQGNGNDFTGTGDLFAALFLANNTNYKNAVKAFECTISTLQSVIKRTLDLLPDDVRSSNKKLTCFEKELKIVQSKELIEKPLEGFQAKIIV